MSKKDKHVVATVMQQMTDILNREPIELLLYGTDNQGQSYFMNIGENTHDFSRGMNRL